MDEKFELVGDLDNLSSLTNVSHLGVWYYLGESLKNQNQLTGLNHVKAERVL
jgi:hypothetical protein